MADLLPQVIPVDEIKSTTQHVSTNDAELKATPELPVDAFEGDDEIIKAEIQETLDTEEAELPPKEIQPDEEVFKDAKPKKKKRVISDAQREHLAQARKKALEVRRRKAQEKKLAKQQENRKKKKEQAQKKNLNAVHNPMESESEEEEPPPQHRKMKSHAFDDIDEDLLVQLQERAIEKYEVKRKARKEVKKKKQDEDDKQEQIYRTVKKAVQPTADPDDMWSVCFQ